MHYSNLVIVKPEDGKDLDSLVGECLAPWDENKTVAGFWDWYQIGGRWTGIFDGYHPDTDPRNMETCTTCGGSGKRTDMEVRDGCNGCHGFGQRVKWPTDWPQRMEDSIPVEALTQEHLAKFHRFVFFDRGEIWERKVYVPWGAEGSNLPDNPIPRPSLEWIKTEYAGHLAVIVDTHS